MHTLEKYLRDADAGGAIDHTIRARVGAHIDGGVAFYIHPSGRDGQTLEFKVDGNQLTCTSVCGTAAVAIAPAHLG